MIIEIFRVIIVVFILAQFLLSSHCLAGGYYHFGARAMAMGGAYTAIVNDESAVYWNPAGISLLGHGSFNVTYGYRDENYKDAQDPLNALVEGGLIDHTDPLDPLSNVRNRLLAQLDEKGVGIERTENRIFCLAAPNFALTSLGYKIACSAPKIPDDTSNPSVSNPVVEPSMKLSGMDVIEWILTGAYFKAQNYYALGFNLKTIQASVHYDEVPIHALIGSDSKDLFDQIFDLPSNKEWKFTVDLGYIMMVSHGRVALAIKNIYEPEFKGPGNYKEKLERTMRMGYAYMPNNSFTIGIDIDLTKQQNNVIKYSSREIALGVEKTIGTKNIFAMRFGVLKNIAESDDAFNFSGGFGFETKIVKFDVGYARDMDGNDTNLQISASLNF